MKLNVPEVAAESSSSATPVASLGEGQTPPVLGIPPRQPGTSHVASRAAQLNRDAVLSATPVRLLTMLYDRLLLDLTRAERAQLSSNWPMANEQLQHAQAILAELSSSLKLDSWDGAEGLLALYTYVTNALVVANIHRDTDRIREAVALLEPLRTAWHDAAALVPLQSLGDTNGGGLGIA